MDESSQSHRPLEGGAEPKKLKRMLNEIIESAVTPRWNPIIESAFLGVVILIVDIVLIRQFSRQDLTLILAQIIAWALIPVVLAMAFIQTKRLREFRSAIPHKLRKSGILEKVGLGLDALPDIFAHTPFPFKLTLGLRPKTLRVQLSFVASHILWYLRDKPSTYFGIGWQGVAQSSLFLVFLWSTMGARQAPLVMFLMLMFGCLAAVELPLIGSFTARHAYAAHSFLEELIESLKD